jgi:beta-fructofuranosidase
VVALQTSTDLAAWTEAEELYSTFLTHCPECPEIFRLGDRWILGYSRFTDRRGTVYRVADNPRGPWRHFATEGPDGMNWYAAKSLTDDAGRRIAFGWVPDRNPAPSAITGNWLWGGDLAIPRELSLDSAGQLAMRPAAELSAISGSELSYLASYGSGAWAAVPAGAVPAGAVPAGAAGPQFTVDSPGGFGYCILRPAVPVASYTLSVTVSGGQDAAIFGLAVQTNEQLDCGVAVLCYPGERRVSAVDLTAARSELANEYEKATTEYASVAEGCLPGHAFDAVTLSVMVRGDVIEAFVADTVCLTYRLPTAVAGSVALLIQDGSARFTDVRGQLVGHAE